MSAKTSSIQLNLSKESVYENYLIKKITTKVIQLSGMALFMYSIQFISSLH